MLLRVHHRAFQGLITPRPGCFYALGRRTLVDLSERRKEFEAKYAEKLQQRAKSEGISVEELKKKLAETAKTKPERIEPLSSWQKQKQAASDKPVQSQARKDSAPIKPLADIMDIRKILGKNHTRDEVAALWTTYHATRSQSTGRGYLSAVIPLETYEKMTSKATKYRRFILPLPRPSPESDKEIAHEFFFVQWDFYEAPPHPALTPGLPFEEPLPAPASPAPNPSCSTVLFTTLQEYKLRQSFALPYLVLTSYTDLASTHGIVLMRGELTASPTSPDKYLLSQADAQMLALSTQRFYLADEGDSKTAGRARLLRVFEEKPEDFKWEDLLGFADPTV
ncbi:hypothetical protein M422DRAFT_67210 [Sphaerobolus stellatus SS14]|uniref:ATP synthase mitochondrial F1 complex assembly factor 1 n=1 Tax=Sphaerobolus stellatus (strain SS14) TaxID=990650 RepID=A0A0C9VRK5_SPHS4|nr:hypothetical protein M422DRAFT_67210 [Sphaerobolus stellatus SS14]